MKHHIENHPDDLRRLLEKAKKELAAALASNAKLYVENKRLREAAEKP